MQADDPMADLKAEIRWAVNHDKWALALVLIKALREGVLPPAPTEGVRERAGIPGWWEGAAPVPPTEGGGGYRAGAREWTTDDHEDLEDEPTDADYEAAAWAGINDGRAALGLSSIPLDAVSRETSQPRPRFFPRPGAADTPPCPPPSPRDTGS